MSSAPSPVAAAVATAVPTAVAVDDDAAKAAKKAQAEAAKAANAAAKAEAAAAKAAADAEAKAQAVVAAAIRDKNVGTKVANTFGTDTYFGTVTTARTADGVDYYQVTYSDGDQEELELGEVEAAHDRYLTAQADMWNLMVQLVGLDAAGVAALQAGGITSIAQLELFGGGVGHHAFDQVAGLSLLAKQQLHVVATFLLHDGILTPASSLAELARFNLAKQNGSVPKAAGAPKATRKKRTPATPTKKRKKTVPKKATTPKKKPGRPAKKATASPGKRGRPKKN